MSVLRNKNFLSVLWILTISLLVIFFLIISSSYFNTKEINIFTAQCYEMNGEVNLEIHNNITSNYSLECKK
ncbi:Uncharacterised protein [Lysinibacillus sphaericus]|nr:Uncharacterised protein [Lysinibacillus sphaericus]